MGMFRREHEGDCATEIVGDDMSFGAVATTRSANRFTKIALR